MKDILLHYQKEIDQQNEKIKTIKTEMELICNKMKERIGKSTFERAEKKALFVHNTFVNSCCQGFKVTKDGIIIYSGINQNSVIMTWKEITMSNEEWLNHIKQLEKEAYAKLSKPY